MVEIDAQINMEIAGAVSIIGDEGTPEIVVVVTGFRFIILFSAVICGTVSKDSGIKAGISSLINPIKVIE